MTRRSRVRGGARPRGRTVGRVPIRVPGRVASRLRRHWVEALLLLSPLVPIWVTVIRFGLSGVYPNSDAALTVLRASTVFSRHPPLVGMPAAGAHAVHGTARFPGAIQLYVLAGPWKILGDVWGPIVAMALLNSVWILLAGWLLVRMLPRSQRIVALGFVSVFCWSIGNTFLVEPTPVEMLLFPFVLFLIAVWAAGERDPVGMVVLAVTANYLWLDHLVLVMVVPVVGAYVPIALWVQRTRRRRDGAQDDPVEARRFRRSVAAAGVITVVMWLPTVAQQVFGAPRNLSLLVESAQAGTGPTRTWPDAWHVVVSMIARPPFWLRGSIGAPPYFARPIGPKVAGDLSVFDVVVTCALIAGVISIVLVLRNRHDGRGIRLLLVAALAVVIQVPNVQLAPSGQWISSGYYRSVWGAAMFLWMAVATSLLRIVRPRVGTRAAWVSIAGVGVVTLLSLPVAPDGYGSDPGRVAATREVNRLVLRNLAHRHPVRGTVAVTTPPNLDASVYASALLLRLRSAGIPACVDVERWEGTPDRPACPPGPLTTLNVSVHRRSASPDTSILFTVQILTPAEQAEIDRLENDLVARLSQSPHLSIDRSVVAELGRDRGVRASLQRLQDSMTEAGDDPRPLLSDRTFLLLLEWHRSEGRSDRRLLNVDLPARKSLGRWLDLQERDGIVVVRRTDG